MGEPSTRSTGVSALLAVAAVIAVVALAGGLAGGSQETGQLDTYEFVAADHSLGEGVVIMKTLRGGYRFCGLTIGEPEPSVQVAITLSGSCEMGDAEQWPTNRSACAGPPGLVGQISGGGRTATGDLIVMVETLLDRDCHQSVELGMTWPPTTAQCEPEPDDG